MIWPRYRTTIAKSECCDLFRVALSKRPFLFLGRSWTTERGKAFRRVLLADALGIKPSSSKFRDLLSSSYKYGLTEGTEKSVDMSLTPTEAAAAQTKDPARRMTALRTAALTPPVFKDFSTSYAENKHPSPDMMAKILTSDFDVPLVFADQCASLINENGRYVEMIRDLSGSASVLMDTDSDTVTPDEDLESGDEAEEIVDDEEVEAILPPASNPPASEQRPRAIFLGHGKKHGPLEKLEKILRSFQLSTKRPEKKRI